MRLFHLECIDKLSCDTIRDYLLFANHYAAYSTTKKGAIASYANLEEIQEPVVSITSTILPSMLTTLSFVCISAPSLPFGAIASYANLEEIQEYIKNR